MAFPLSLPSRPRKVRARMALDDGEPDFTVPKLIAWCGTNMSRQEILDLVDSLSGLAAKMNDDAQDDEPAGTPDREAFNRERAKKSEEALARKLAGDSRRAGHISTAATDSFAKMFPDAGRLKQSL